jgi:hypothetical protein
LLIDRDLTIVAAPRLGRFLFSAPDNKPFYKAGDEIPFTFFGSGDTRVFGVSVRTAIVDLNAPAPGRVQLSELNPLRVKMRLDGFISQRVLCLNGHWVSRGDVIKHIANIGSGIHSGEPESLTEKTISRIRRLVWYTKSGDSVEITCNMPALELRADPIFHYNPDAIDPALLELMATITLISMSEDTSRLEQIIKNELA